MDFLVLHCSIKREPGQTNLSTGHVIIHTPCQFIPSLCFKLFQLGISKTKFKHGLKRGSLQGPFPNKNCQRSDPTSSAPKRLTCPLLTHCRAGNTSPGITFTSSCKNHHFSGPQHSPGTIQILSTTKNTRNYNHQFVLKSQCWNSL